MRAAGYRRASIAPVISRSMPMSETGCPREAESSGLVVPPRMMMPVGEAGVGTQAGKRFSSGWSRKVPTGVNPQIARLRMEAVTSFRPTGTNRVSKSRQPSRPPAAKRFGRIASVPRVLESKNTWAEFAIDPAGWRCLAARRSSPQTFVSILAQVTPRANRRREHYRDSQTASSTSVRASNPSALLSSRFPNAE